MPHCKFCHQYVDRDSDNWCNLSPTNAHQFEEHSASPILNSLVDIISTNISESLFSNSDDNTSGSIDTSSTNDFGGFDGGDTGGGGASGDW